MRRSFILALLALPLGAQEFRVGAGAVKITPPPGAPMAGYYYNRAADGVHDDLWAKAIVIESGGTRAALVACDLASMPRALAEEARARIAKVTGIPSSHVMISATHTHTGPVLVTGGSRYRLQGEMRHIGEQYAADLPARVVEAVERAAANMQPARVLAAIGREPSLTFNRRFHMKDGTVVFNPGKRNPNIVRPAGPIDADVPVVYFESGDGKPVATYVNYALHLDTVGGTEYSADYPYTLARLLAGAKDPAMLTLFTIGCAGNLNHIDVSTRERQKGHDEAARIGTILAAEVLKSYRRLESMEAGPLRARSEIVRLAVPEVAAADVEWARGVAATFGTEKPAPFLELVRSSKILDVVAREGKPIEAEVQVVALGKQLAWVALPGEIFTELGLAIKAASPFPYTVVAELANGSIGYVPDRKGFRQGAYEAISARCAPGCGEALVEAATRLLVELAHGSNQDRPVR